MLLFRCNKLKKIRLKHTPQSVVMLVMFGVVPLCTILSTIDQTTLLVAFTQEDQLILERVDDH